MHLDFTMAVGAKMIQSLIFMKKKPSEGKAKVRCKAAMERKS